MRTKGEDQGARGGWYVCQECGYESAKWLGRCPACVTIYEEAVPVKSPLWRVSTATSLL